MFLVQKVVDVVASVQCRVCNVREEFCHPHTHTGCRVEGEHGWIVELVLIIINEYIMMHEIQ